MRPLLFSVPGRTCCAAIVVSQVVEPAVIALHFPGQCECVLAACESDSGSLSASLPATPRLPDGLSLCFSRSGASPHHPSGYT